ncbi:MAG: N-acetylglucosamine-6-phosphate deacetylase [Armatimonadota bacterium]|nr:N-acetylglucosamine-6-phosphate deacetylase [Armatimonadota bacterium]MDR7611813.1 N-acetylglucosamine-6-phosphate deacetylase [Armatimonadota bacterium]
MQTPPVQVISAGRVVTPSGDLTPGTVEVRHGRIAAVRRGSSGRADVAAPDGILAPGLIDLQVNGAAGADFLTCRRPADVDRARRYLASCGVTTFLPTLITSPPAALAAALDRWERWSRLSGGPRVGGLHLEGPYLNPQYRGAHPARYLRPPDRGQLAALLDRHPGLVRLVTLAPELPGAGALIGLLRERGVAVAAGHTGATYDQAREAFAAGVSLVTHLFNGMRAVHHRDPGIVVAALEHEEVAVSLIADFVHVHPAVLRLAARLKGPRRTVLVTDAVAAAGLRGGRARLGSRRVRVTDVPRLADGTIVGSVLALDQAVRNMVALGFPLRDVIAMASSTPARILGRPDLGRIAVGGIADLVLFDAGLRVRAVWVGGERIVG